jgi:GTP-binding protein EngB required for normal cell division
MIAVLEKYFVLTGRPNAGKSSIIRAVVNLDVRVGKHPGTTRRVSKYPLSDGLIVVDMPGFGRRYGTSKRLEDRTNDEIIGFLESNAQSIVLAVHVLDISTFLDVTQRLEKKGFISVDVEMVHFLAKTLGEFPLVAANKIDKTNKKDIEVNLEEFMHQLSDGYPSTVSDCVFPVSAKTREGLGALKSAIHERLVAKGYKTPFARAH